MYTAYQATLSVTTTDLKFAEDTALTFSSPLPPLQQTKQKITLLLCHTAAKVRNLVCLPREPCRECTGRRFLQDRDETHSDTPG